MPEAPLVLRFRDPRCRQVALAGGKGASLATMTAEDLPVPPGFVIASTAFEAAVDTDGLAEVLANVVRCWLSFFTERAVFYRREKGSMDDVAMAVVVQQMVDSQKSGVLFTVDPVSGRVLVVSASGMGLQVIDPERVVS